MKLATPSSATFHSAKYIRRGALLGGVLGILQDGGYDDPFNVVLSIKFHLKHILTDTWRASYLKIPRAPLRSYEDSKFHPIGLCTSSRYRK